jgi:hypothetical protein
MTKIAGKDGKLKAGVFDAAEKFKMVQKILSDMDAVDYGR